MVVGHLCRSSVRRRFRSAQRRCRRPRHSRSDSGNHMSLLLLERAFHYAGARRKGTLGSYGPEGPSGPWWPKGPFGPLGGALRAHFGAGFASFVSF